MEKETLHFTITGEFLTNFARQRFIETGKREIGIDFLCESLHGFPRDMAADVVSGRAKLIGQDVVTLTSDNSTVEPPKWIKPNQIEECACGWIAPDGRVFGCKEYNPGRLPHECLAERIAERDDCGISEGGSAYLKLEKEGWLKFSPHLAITDCPPAKITKAQQLELVKYMKYHNYALSLGWHTNANYLQVQAMETLQFGRLVNYIMYETNHTNT